MGIKKIKYLNVVNDSLDVFVTLESNAFYLVEVATVNSYQLLWKNMKVILYHSNTRISLSRS